MGVGLRSGAKRKLGEAEILLGEGRGDERSWEQSGEPTSHEWQLWERGGMPPATSCVTVGD